MFDIAIIGAGPVGLLLANLLGQRGHSVLVLEKQPLPYPMPRAIHFDGETMRAFQSAGLADQVLEHTHIGKGMLFRDSKGTTLIDWSRDQTPGPMGWHESYRFHQPALEQVLRDGLGRFANVTLQTGAEAIRLGQNNDAAVIGLSNDTVTEARYVIGCDGTGSFTRQALGIGLHDLGFQERWLVVDVLANTPAADLGDHSIQFCDPNAPATYVRGIANRRRWEMRLPADTPETPETPETLTDAQVWQHLSRWITPNDATLERAAVYTFRSRIANSWRQGRILLAGDAAHQMPPFMGQGMCAGLRDAANLGWKFSAVLNGAGDTLLNSYQSEREANARAFIAKSVALGQLINQTATGTLPTGRMRSIWPDLGPGLGPRDGIGGTLAPQVTNADGQRADDMAGGGFYILSATPVANPPLPCITGAQDWLVQRDLAAAILRPDGYCLCGVRNIDDLTAAAQQAITFNTQLGPQ